MSAGRPAAAVVVSLRSKEHAQALQWFLRHLSYEDALASTPPHLSKQARSDRAYAIVHAAVALQESIEAAGLYGDHWMYQEEIHA